MRFQIWLYVLGLCVAAHSDAANLTQSNVAKASEIISKVVGAYGGGERLDSLKTLIVEQQTIGTAVGQSLKPKPPWDRNDNAGISAVDLDNDVFVTRSNGTGGGFEFSTATIIDGDNSVQIDYRAGTVTPTLEPDFAATAGPFMRVTPVLLVQQLREHARTAHYLGDVVRHENTHHVVGFSMTVGPAISLYVDASSGLLTHSERVFPGFGLVEYDFLDYTTVAGIPFNKRFLLHLNGDLNLERTNLVTQVNQPLDRYLAIDDHLARMPPTAPDAFGRQQLAAGVYQIGGNGTYAMFIEMDDHVIAVGGTAGSPQRLASLREVIAQKPVTYGVLTHHHSDHVLAVPSFVQAGATIVTAKAHAQVARDAAGADADPALKTVSDRLVLEDETRRVEIIDIGPTAHSEHLLVAWLPETGILFEADHFAMPLSGAAPPAVASTRSFAAALREHNLQPRLMVSAHSPRGGTMDDLRAALARQARDVEVSRLD